MSVYSKHLLSWRQLLSLRQHQRLPHHPHIHNHSDNFGIGFGFGHARATIPTNTRAELQKDIKPDDKLNDIVFLYKGDASKIVASALAYGSNTGLGACAGLAHYIFAKGGRAHERYCQSYRQKDIRLGDTIVTPAVNLHVPKLLHCALDSQFDVDNVRQCYESALLVAATRRTIRSVVFPSLASALPGWKASSAALCTVQSIRHWLDCNPEQREKLSRIVISTVSADELKYLLSYMEVFFPAGQAHKEVE